VQKIELNIMGLSYSQSQSNSYALILGETDGNRRLPIVIGHFEAQAIALELEKMKPARPLTHDLFKSFADEFGITLEEVIINKFHEGIFYSLLICTNGSVTRKIDARTSDAVALSIRFGCPIYTYENIMAQAGIVYQEENEENPAEEPVKPVSGYAGHTLEELNELLQKAVEEEDYEKASQIRDEINRRK
jgi:bifunctional DNase/RNase